MNDAQECISCRKKIANDAGSVRFLCPNCSKIEIIRCTECRKTAAKYNCPDCGFVGPN